MTQPAIEANISEVEGAYYPVRLYAIPRVGELIDLYSFIDAKTGHKPRKFYEVVAVLHKMYDVGETVGGRDTAHHFVTVLVKPSHSEYLDCFPS